MSTNFTKPSLLLTAGLLAMTASSALAQDASGSMASGGCTSLITDNRGAGGELYGLKVHNPGNGPDEHTDWVFDLSAKGGAAIPGVDAGGSSYFIPDVWKKPVVPPEHMFVIVTYPNGWVAVDSGDTRQNAVYGTVNIQRVGNALPVGVAAGTGVELPGTASSYEIPIITDRVQGGSATFPFGTRDGIEVAFAPLAEVNASEWSTGAGCSIGGETEDPHASFGLVVGYNVFRLEGTPVTPPTPADFIGAWQYYMPYRDFMVGDPGAPTPDTAGTAVLDLNGDTLPDGDGTDAPTDGNADGDLVGLQNPDGLPFTGDEILIFQDSAKNPDGTPREFGAAPDRSGRTGYWYAFQPVLFAGPSAITDLDGLGFTRSDLFVGQHTLDVDGNMLADALDLDMDGSPEFYSPQAEFGIRGYGLTNDGLPVISPPVFGRANPAIAVGNIVLQGRVIDSGVEITFAPAFERADVMGYNVYRIANTRSQHRVLVNSELIAAIGGSGNMYRLVDSWPATSRRLAPTRLTYLVEIVFADGDEPKLVGPFSVQAGSDRRR